MNFLDPDDMKESLIMTEGSKKKCLRCASANDSITHGSTVRRRVSVTHFSLPLGGFRSELGSRLPAAVQERSPRSFPEVPSRSRRSVSWAQRNTNGTRKKNKNARERRLPLPRFFIFFRVPFVLRCAQLTERLEEARLD